MTPGSGWEIPLPGRFKEIVLAWNGSPSLLTISFRRLPLQHARQQFASAKYLAAYFILAFLFSWSIAVPLALAHQDLIAPLLPPWTHYLVGYGPALAALILALVDRDRTQLRDLVARATKWKVWPVWWLVALSPLVLALLVGLVANQLHGGEIQLADLGAVNFLPPIGLGALALWLFTFGFGEEVGWRGYALPRLQRGRSALLASLILAFLWALWHLPMFFYLYDPSIAVGWFFGILSGTIVFTWLFNSTGGSVLLVAVWHAGFDFVTSTSAGGGVLAMVVSIAVMVWAVVIIILYKPADLSSVPKVQA